MLRRFWFGRFAAAGGTLPGAVPAFVDVQPFIDECYIGKTVRVIAATVAIGVSPAPTITTEIISAAGNVLPASYVVQDGDKLRVRQTVSNPAGSEVTQSGWVYAQQEVADYTDLTPVPCSFAVALTSAAQPGSRLHYVSSSSPYTPAESGYYFWTGSAICDSTGSLTGAGGVAYGSDWRNPSGPIKPYRHMSACLPTNNGLAPGVRSGSPEIGGSSYSPPASGRPRFEKPDRWLFLRGDTFNCDTDLAAYQVYCPTFVPISGFLLGTPGGADAYNLRVFCDYGPSSQPRPRFTQPKNRGGPTDTSTNTKHAFMSGIDKYSRYVGLHYDGQTRDADYTGNLSVVNVGTLAASQKNNGFEDCFFDGCGVGDPVGGQSKVYLYKCIGVDCWTSTRNFAHIAGIHSTVDDPGIVQGFGCIFARNGFAGINPALVEGGTYTPPAHNPATAYVRDDVVLSGGEWWVLDANTVAAGVPITSGGWRKVTDSGGRRALSNLYERNLYLAGRADFTDSIILRGGSGEQWRSGGQIHRNFIQAGAVVVSDWQQTEENENQTCCMTWNVIQNVDQVGVHTSMPLQVQLGCHFSLFEYNACTFAAEGNAGTAVYMASRQERYDSNLTSIKNRTRGNIIRKNLLHAGSGFFARLVDGIWGGIVEGTYTMNPDVETAVFPSLTGNRLIDNDVIASVALTLQYRSLPVEGPLAPLTTDTQATGNTAYATREAYAAANGGTAPNRTLKTYLQSIGVTVNSIDGVHEFVAAARNLSRFNWPEQYTAKAINNYIRGGLGSPLQA